ncbi:MAG: zinc-ribbon domain-containing protein [Lachnospiraceae bacterium]|nr:zinc-ribbon domain-containing protein [Lachnospiraceae bacterium]
MKFCTSCGQQMDDNANVCPQCGAVQGDGMQSAGASVQGGYSQAGAYAPARSGFRISIGGIVAAVGYLLILIALFVPMYSDEMIGFSLSEMGSAVGFMGGAGYAFVLFYLPLIMVIIGIACALVSVFTRNKVLLLVVTIFEVLFSVIAIVILIIAKSEIGFGVSFSVGFFLWIIGIVVALVGMIMDYAGKRRG